MDIINHQEHHYAKETLMRRLAVASQYKIYPSIIPRNELPLRKILLTTRLWDHVCKQQAILTMTSDDWLFEQQQSPPVQQQQPQEQEQDVILMFKPEQETSSNEDIPNSKEQDQWSWLDNTQEPVLLDSLSHEETQQLETTKTEKKRARSTEEHHHPSKKPQTFIHHFSTIDSPASPAGPASPRPSSPTSAVLLSA